MNKLISGKGRKLYVKKGTDFESTIKAKRLQAVLLDDENSQSSIASSDGTSLSVTRHLYVASASLIANEESNMPPPLPKNPRQNSAINVAPPPAAFAPPSFPMMQAQTLSHPNGQQFWPGPYGFPPAPSLAEEQMKEHVKQVMEPWIKQIKQIADIGEVGIITEQFQPALSGDIETPKQILKMMLKERKEGSAVRVALREIFKDDDCTIAVRTQRGTKMSSADAVVLDKTKLDQVQELASQWCVSLKKEKLSQHEFEDIVKHFLDECKRHKKKTSAAMQAEN